MVCNNWTNLNGLRDYAIVAKNAAKLTAFEGEILVPYSLESALKEGSNEVVSKVFDPAREDVGSYGK